MKCDNTFRVCAMLYNHMLRNRNHHTIGSEESDWETAQTDRDDARIQGTMGSFSEAYLPPYFVNDEALGNDTVQEVDADHHMLRSALVTHYRLEHDDKKILWPKSALKLRGRVDNRPRLGAGEHLDADERHAFISESESDGDSSDDDPV